MLHLLGLSGLVLVHLAFPAHGALVKRSTLQCTPRIADMYCKMHIESSRNPSGKCKDDAVVCYMTSPKCTNAAGCEGACRPLAEKDLFVQPQCIRNQCRCEVSGPNCTNAAGCESACSDLADKDIFVQPQCIRNQCHCEVSGHFSGCTSDADCRSACEKHPGKKLTSAQCMSDQNCLCEYEEECTQARCKERCMIQHKGKVVHYSKCLPNNQCFCKYSDRGTGRAIRPGTGTAIPPGTGTAIRPSVLTIAIILLSTLAPIPAPAEGKLGALLIPSAIFVLSTSELAFG